MLTYHLYFFTIFRYNLNFILFGEAREYSYNVTHKHNKLLHLIIKLVKNCLCAYVHVCDVSFLWYFTNLFTSFLKEFFKSFLKELVREIMEHYSLFCMK